MDWGWCRGGEKGRGEEDRRWIGEGVGEERGREGMGIEEEMDRKVGWSRVSWD